MQYFSLCKYFAAFEPNGRRKKMQYYAQLCRQHFLTPLELHLYRTLQSFAPLESLLADVLSLRLISSVSLILSAISNQIYLILLLRVLHRVCKMQRTHYPGHDSRKSNQIKGDPILMSSNIIDVIRTKTKMLDFIDNNYK